MSGRPYLASSDSALLRQALRGRKGASFLEIGAGNCGTLVEASERFEIAVGTDIVRPTMEDWKRSGADFILADGASCVREGAFDLVAFNPPYLPVEESVDPAVEGGMDLGVPIKFLKDALRAVKGDGEVVWLLNDQAEVGEFAKICSAWGLGMRRVASEREFFEELVVYAASSERPRQDRPAEEPPRSNPER